MSRAGSVAVCTLLGFRCFGQTTDLTAKADRAATALTAGRFSEAIALYRELSRALPADAGLKKNLGLALYSAGQYREAITAFDAVLRQQPADPSVSFLLGVSSVRIGKPDIAVVPLRQAVAAQPGNPMFRFELADALIGAGRPDEAIADFLELVHLRPEVPDYWYGLGTAYTLCSRHIFGEIERSAPESGYWHALLARSRAEQREFGSAFYSYKRALQQIPGLPGIHAALAAVYLETGHPEWSATELQREREAPHPDCGAHPLECRFRSGRLDDLIAASQGASSVEDRYWRAEACSELAAQAFRRVLDLPPSSASHRLRAELAGLQNHHAEASKEWGEALTLSPANEMVELELIKSLRASHDYKGAEDVLARALGRQPASAQLNYLMGDTLLALQEPKRAIPWLQKALRVDRNDVGIRLDLGKALLQTGDAEGALIHFQAAAVEDQEGGAYYLLSQALARTGREAASQRALDKRQQLIRAEAARKAERERNYAIAAPD